ncbi:thiol-disulfide isomerase/thioredoxin [Pedobacter africanus]|uniref:Thiol-disulfide isomerase/thioredoxin n=1 Tax=Pedobacter africanus TaxID=151894 RepID=A0ACC6KZR8_9SPHI|nr:hypothetical protein [Pedobacter africanus]MDR6784578.1 thiol-disulfide isomerase/thioredoxin [Pedobacter africanus]
MKVKLNFLTALLVVGLQGFGQNSSLKVGQQLPDLEINRILYHTPGKAKLSDYKGKLIILDFWGPNCSSCIDDMPKMDSLQKYFGDKVVFLPIIHAIPTKGFNKAFVNQIDSFWRITPKLFKTDLPTILDNDFAQYFPRRVAFQVWIDGNRVVRAIAHPEYVNKKEIQKMLDGIYPQWESEIKEFSYEKPVSEYLVRPEFSGLKDQNYAFFTTYLRGIDSYTDIDTSGSKILVSYKNADILSFYRKYLLTNGLTPTNILLETKDSVRYFTKGYRNEWLRDNSYCYELKLNRKVDEKTLADYIRQDANKYFGLNGLIENRMAKCLILTKSKNGPKKVVFSDKSNMTKISIEELYNGIRSLQNYLAQTTGKNAWPILNESGVAKDISLYIPKKISFSSPNDIPVLQKVLKTQGYDIVEGRRMQKMFVISEIN